MDPVNLQIQSVLKYHEVLWSKILESDRVDHIEIARAASDVRGMLKAAMDSAGTMFESNIQCLTHILSLQKEKASIIAQHQTNIEELNGRIASLMDIISSLQAKVESTSSVIRLKAMWEKVIAAHSSYLRPNEASPNSSPTRSAIKHVSSDDTTTALAMLSAIFANEVNHSDTASNSLVHHLLQKVTEVEHLITGDSKKYQEENDQLRQKLQEKSAKLHSVSKSLSEYKAKSTSRKTENYKLQCYIKSLEEKMLEYEDRANQVQNIADKLEEALIQSKQNYDTLTQQYKEAVNIADQWKATCQQHEQTLIVQRLSSGLSSKGTSPNISPRARSNPRQSLLHIPSKVRELAEASRQLRSQSDSPDHHLIHQQYFSNSNNQLQSPSSAPSPKFNNRYELLSPTSLPNEYIDDSLQQPYEPNSSDKSYTMQDEPSKHNRSLEDVLTSYQVQAITPQKAPLPEVYPSHLSAQRAVITPSPQLSNNQTNAGHITPQSYRKAFKQTIDSEYHGGFISDATRKKLERKGTPVAGRKVVRQSVEDQHLKKHDNEIINGDTSMSMSMEKDVAAAVAKITALMPWDD